MVSRDEGRRLVQAALALHLLNTGLSRTSLRQLAGAAGISDRMLLYYYADKAEALAAAMAAVAAGIAEQLAAAVPTAGLLSARESGSHSGSNRPAHQSRPPRCIRYTWHPRHLLRR